MAGLLAALTGAPSRDEALVRHDNVPPAALRSAQATLLALRAALPPDDVHSQLYFLLPNPVPMDRDAAVAWLARFEKPALCYGFAVADFVAIGCWADTARAGRLAKGEPEPRMLLLEGMREDPGEQPNSRSILLQGHGEFLALSVDEFVEWHRHYSLQFVSSIPATPTEGQRRSGIRVVYNFFGLDGSDSGGVEHIDERSREP